MPERMSIGGLRTPWESGHGTARYPRLLQLLLLYSTLVGGLGSFHFRLPRTLAVHSAILSLLGCTKHHLCSAMGASLTAPACACLPACLPNFLGEFGYDKECCCPADISLEEPVNSALGTIPPHRSLARFPSVLAIMIATSFTVMMSHDLTLSSSTT